MIQSLIVLLILALILYLIWFIVGKFITGNAAPDHWDYSGPDPAVIRAQHVQAAAPHAMKEAKVSGPSQLNETPDPKWERVKKEIKSEII